MPPEQAYPVSQRELIRAARGQMSKTAFAKVLGVDRSCLSRYEGEKLGAPTSVLNHCLRAVAAQLGDESPQDEQPLERVLRSAREVVSGLEVSLAQHERPNR